MHQHKHPLATYVPGTVLGYRRNGAPIYAIAGGSGEGDIQVPGTNPDVGTAQPPQPAQGSDTSGQGTQPNVQPEQGDGTDWKAHAREWEKRAKANAKAADELEKIRKQNQSEQEKAVEEAEARGRASAAKDYGSKLAQARFEAAAAQAGVNLSEVAEFISVAQFVGEDGEVDDKAIKAAVAKFAKLAPARGAARSGGDFSGGSGDQPASLDKQIADAESRRDFATAIRLKRQKAAQT
ncbi:hypothetical protein ACH5A3_02945 [Streptomyces echinatus]|uniref:hypothetical protein n=1 Tax=Streptomyces echinatus TaxID=67293 RepID=UPI0037AABD7C